NVAGLKPVEERRLVDEMTSGGVHNSASSFHCGKSLCIKKRTFLHATAGVEGYQVRVLQQSGQFSEFYVGSYILTPHKRICDEDSRTERPQIFFHGLSNAADSDDSDGPFRQQMSVVSPPLSLAKIRTVQGKITCQCEDHPERQLRRGFHHFVGRVED